MAIKLNKSKMVTNLVRNTKFVQHLDRAIGMGDFVWNFDYEPKKSDTGWHPSGHCTPSPAELYHMALETDKERAQADNPNDGSAPIQKNKKDGFPPSLYKTFMVGHFWHQYLQWITVEILDFAKPEAIERTGKKGWGDCIHSGGLKHEVCHYADWHYATGSGDIAPVYIPTWGEFLVDFKTMGAHMYKPNIPPGDTIIKWECQANIYMDFFDLERALIVGICKDSPHDFKEFEFHRNQPLVDAIYGKWQLVSACIDEGIEPPVDEVIELPTRGPVEQ